MPAAQYIRVGLGGPFSVVSVHAVRGLCAGRWVRMVFVCLLALVWLPRASAAPSANAGDDSAVASPASATASDANPPLDFTLPVVTGGHWRLAEHRGRVVWLALVAPWCGQCAGFVNDVAARLKRADEAALENRGAVMGNSVFMVVSAVDARGDGLDVRLDSDPAASQQSSADRQRAANAGKAFRASGNGAERTQLLIDRDGTVLRTFDPAELPWLVRIDEDGVLVAAGTDLNVLAPARIEPGLWQNLQSRWRRLWGQQE